MVTIAPSLAAAPLHHLEKVIDDLNRLGVGMIHFDVEDGSFVPVMTLGVKIISDLRPLSRLPFDVHLMMRQPEWIIGPLAEMGADWVSVHYEACPYPRRTLGLIKRHGMKAGLAFNPKTELPPLQIYRPHLDYVLILTTEPEYDDAPFLPGVLEKVARGRQQLGLEGVKWMVDGGIAPGNIAEVVRAGADIVVVGRSLFKQGSLEENYALLKKSMEG
ncbi:MAG: ribulose-phosphate 3-epimerase [Firmicutes bacterium]|jgi:ribulose-phosphate 3-epimerase|nr:ribulose-phosphate 3-epimerase [Bacillota bacterium]